MRLRGSRKALTWVAGPLIGVMLAVSPASAGTDDTFPERRPLTRDQAAEFLAGASTDRALLNSKIRAAIDDSRLPGADQATRRALTLLTMRPSLPAERVWLAPGGTPIRYTLAEGSNDRISSADRDRDGVPDALQVVALGLAQARTLLVDQLGLLHQVG